MSIFAGVLGKVIGDEQRKDCKTHTNVSHPWQCQTSLQTPAHSPLNGNFTGHLQNYPEQLEENNHYIFQEANVNRGGGGETELSGIAGLQISCWCQFMTSSIVQKNGVGGQQEEMMVVPKHTGLSLMGPQHSKYEAIAWLGFFLLFSKRRALSRDNRHI